MDKITAITLLNILWFDGWFIAILYFNHSLW
jgi:hypothetical protein